MKQGKSKYAIVLMSESYIPPFAMRLQRMGHPSVGGRVKRTTSARAAKVLR
jgi:hypothetical protein